VIAVEVVHVTAERTKVVPVKLDAGATVRQAIAKAGLPLEPGGAVGVFGRVCALDAPLNDGDRVEIYRPLPEDPKEIRRRRAREGRRR
jgi:putative ubiquitin-RnfH superfamily antitoxin RatB of RatAB toxin-antitoxin module